MSTVKRISEIEQRIQCFMDYGEYCPEQRVITLLTGIPTILKWLGKCLAC